MLKHTLEKIVNDNLEDDSHFLVDIVISSSNGPSKILVIIDGDHGVTIDDCARLSRKLGNIIEENNLINSKCILDISSPGLDHPIILQRQYIKNIGRKVRITDLNGDQHEGQLTEATNDQVTINVNIDNQKNKEQKNRNFTFDQIKKTEILVTF